MGVILQIAAHSGEREGEREGGKERGREGEREREKVIVKYKWTLVTLKKLG